MTTTDRGGRPLRRPASLPLCSLPLCSLFLASLLFTAQALPAVSATAGTKAGKKASTDQGDGKKEEEKWDVAHPPLPIKEIDIDTRQGTWMSLDVSPDGTEIVFDLLGDLFRIPLAGGEATALTSGLAWDMQPRFSPDGRSIAFTSDRGGGDNLWILDRQGGEPKGVTEEDFRLLNSPVWSPDGDFIAARKHFTSGRSLGAGEIWLYHRTGGEGVQMTEKPNDQKDVGEPAFSPDGRYLYYSRDITPGKTFEYSKDSNGSIYAIERLDRKKGDIVTLVQGAGGAIRPTPSPDGRSLAFVRRVRFQSVLFLYDLESGAETPLYDGLDRDMQETWAVHGVYPAFAWTPDSASLVFWAHGGIHRLDLASRQVTEIPFHVRARHQMVETARFPQEVGAKRFATKMLRWIQVSPQGDRVVFQALGHLYVRDLPDGLPRRLTAQEEHFEFYPAFSQDGQWIVYTTWQDEQLGTVRRVPASGGEGVVLTSEPGHYIEPAVSPDGETVVYNKIEGGFLRSPTWSREPGLYQVPWAGGTPRRIGEGGAEPHFGADSDRVYFRRGQDDKQALRSVELSGNDPRTHVTTEWASQFRVSPDGRWIAFKERFQAYVAPMPATGRTLELKPDSKALPVRQVSQDAGEDLHWSGDSKTLAWSMGSQLFRQPLPEIFPYLAGPAKTDAAKLGEKKLAAEKLPTKKAGSKKGSGKKGAETEEETDAPAKALGIDLGFEVDSYVPAATVAFVGGRILTLEGDRILEDGTVIVEGDRIVAVGERAQTAVPAGAHIIELAGRTLMPGLVDVHWHGSQADDELTPQQNWNNFASLAFGVTTLHDPSNDTSEIFSAAELARAGSIAAPRIFSTGTILYGAHTSITAEVDSLADARTHLRRMKAAGAFSVKSYNQPRRDQRQQILAAAREEKMLVVPEGGSLLQHNLTMIADGHTGIEHSIPVAAVYDDVLQFWSQSGTAYTPTLVVAYGGIFGENYWYQHTEVWKNERLLTFVPRRLVDSRSRRRVMAPEEEYNHIANAKIAAELSRRGVGVHIGAHGQREGLGAHWELWSFVQGGMTPLEALRSGTLSGARYLGMDHELGSVQVGKLADLIVLEKDPLADIRNSETVDLVMVGGRLFDARTMAEQTAGHEVAAPHFYFAEGGGATGCSTAVCSGPATAHCHH